MIEENSTAPEARKHISRNLITKFKPHHTDLHDDQERKAYTKWIELIEKEVGWYSSLPLTSQTTPLVFVNAPALNGEYLQPPSHKTLRPNHGLYALRVGSHANTIFLAMENRFCELLSFIRADSPPEIGESLASHLNEEIIRMDHEKMLQWTQQRQQACARTGETLVNTGDV